MLLKLTSWDSTVENTNFVQRSSRINFGNTTNMYHSVFTEGGRPNKMVNGLSINWKSWLAIIQHHTSVSVYPQEITHVTLLRLAVPTLLALPGEDRKHMITWFEVCHTLTNALNNPKYQNHQKHDYAVRWMYPIVYEKNWVIKCIVTSWCFSLFFSWKCPYPPASWPNMRGNNGSVPE